LTFFEFGLYLNIHPIDSKKKPFYKPTTTKINLLLEKVFRVSL
jgi:hypothetical protein